MSTRRQSVTHHTCIQIQGQDVQVIIRAMKRKSLRLGVTEQGDVEVKVPLRCPKNELLAFLNKHTAWLEERLIYFRASQKLKSEGFKYLGQYYRFQPSEQKSKSPVLIGDICYYPSNWMGSDLLSHIECWQRKQAKEIFQQLVDQWWPQFSQGALIQYPILRVKKMRTRWGSLSSKGFINLNLNLLEMDRDVIEMVVVHELCHSHFFDHSHNFYKLMEEKLPNYLAIEKKLKAIEKGRDF